MQDWIVGLQKGARARGEGLEPSAWSEVEAATGMPVPEELRELYEAMNGASLPPDVELSPFVGPASVQSQSRVPPSSLPQSGVWVFGKAGADGLLFAARKEAVQGLEARPDWLATVGDDGWLYAWRREDGSIRFYRTLEQLLTRLVPPVETEEVGDITYARALSAVQGALDLLGTDEEAPAEGAGAELIRLVPAKKKQQQKKKASKAARKAKPVAKKRSGPLKKAKRAAAPKKKVKAAVKKRPASKKAVARPAARRKSSSKR